MASDDGRLSAWLADYDSSQITIGVVASHSALQILHGARQEGFRTLGIAVGENRRKMYKAFPGAEPDDWLVLEDYRQMLDELRRGGKRAVVTERELADAPAPTTHTHAFTPHARTHTQ